MLSLVPPCAEHQTPLRACSYVARERQSFVAAHAQREGICDACVIALSVVLDTAHDRHLYAYVVIGTAVVLTGFIIQSKNHASVLQICFYRKVNMTGIGPFGFTLYCTKRKCRSHCYAIYGQIEYAHITT